MSPDSEEQVKFLENFFQQWSWLENVIEFSFCF